MGRRLFVSLFVVVTAVYAVSPVITNYDSYSFFPSAISLVNRQTLSLDAYRHVPAVATSYTVTQSSHHLITAYPWAVSVFAVPAVVVIDILHAAGGPSADSVVARHPQIVSLAQLWSASIVTALACALLGLLVYRRLEGSVLSRYRWALGAGLVFAFATSAWSTASRSLWQHGPAVLFLAAGLLALDAMFPQRDRTAGALSSPRKMGFWCGIAFACAVAMRPTDAVALLLVGLLLIWRSRRAVLAYAGGALCVFVPWILVTDHYYGSFIQPYDRADKLGFTSTFFESIAANLFSPSRGLLVFSPIVLASVAGVAIASRRRTLGPLEILSVAVIIFYLVVIALFPVWWAGDSFGPRFTTETLPFILLLAVPFVDWLREPDAVPWRSRTSAYRAGSVVTAALVLFSVVVNAQGGLLRASTCWNGTPNTPLSVDNKPSRAWSWADPQFDYGLRALGTNGLRAVLHCPKSP